jgi:hypothetical protein
MKLATGLALFLLIAPLGFDRAFSQAPGLLIPQPGATNTVLPIFQKPFAGDYPLGNFSTTIFHSNLTPLQGSRMIFSSPGGVNAPSASTATVATTGSCLKERLF